MEIEPSETPSTVDNPPKSRYFRPQPSKKKHQTKGGKNALDSELEQNSVGHSQRDNAVKTQYSSIYLKPIQFVRATDQADEKPLTQQTEKSTERILEKELVNTQSTKINKLKTPKKTMEKQAEGDVNQTGIYSPGKKSHKFKKPVSEDKYTFDTQEWRSNLAPSLESSNKSANGSTDSSVTNSLQLRLSEKELRGKKSPKHSNISYDSNTKTDTKKEKTKPSKKVLKTKEIRQDSVETHLRSPKKKGKPHYASYYTQNQVEEGLKLGKLFKGKLRINPHNRHESYVTAEGITRDIFIGSTISRNRAFDGDIVVVELFEESRWKVISEGDDAINVLLEDEKIDDKEEEVICSEIPDPITDFPSDTVMASLNANTKIQHIKSIPFEGNDERSAEKNNQREEREGEHLEQQLEVEGVTSESTKGSTQNGEENSTLKAISPISSKVTATSSPLRTSAKLRELQPTGQVIYVLSKERGEQIGFLYPRNPDVGVTPDDRFAMFVPMDIKIPRMVVPIAQIPGFYKDAKSYDKKLAVVKLANWKEDSYFPLGRFESILGEAGEIKAETEALLRLNKVDFRDFSPNIMNTLPQGTYIIPDEEIQRRRDLRQDRIFTIDPATAKDLDDALSVKHFSDGSFQVGVHIADVSFFVTPETPLDKEASRRATTVYLVQKAIPMLPHILCENLCSLNPGVDRLAFSVIWRLSLEGDILDEWFGRTVIRSCSKMPYDVAQQIIEGRIKKDWSETAVDQLYKDLGPTGPHTIGDIVQDIKHLQGIAVQLRKKRYEEGALALNNVKLVFKLDEFGNPLEASPYITKEANHLVEEFMLLANMRVACRIAQAFPDVALLRNHPAPLDRKLEGFTKFCASLGHQVSTSNGKELAESLANLRECYSPVVFQAMQLLATKPMQLAKYFCTGDLETSEWKHFALNVSHYTHFTSPIRRYADIIVHRLLDAALLVEQHPEDMHVEYFQKTLKGIPDKDNCSKIAEHCNEKKLLARKAQEASDNLYLCLLLKSKPAFENGVVLSLGDRFITMILPYFGEEKRVYLEDLPLKGWKWDDKAGILTLDWPQTPGNKDDPNSPIQQSIKVLEMIEVKVGAKPDKFPLDVEVLLLHPSFHSA